MVEVVEPSAPPLPHQKGDSSRNLFLSSLKQSARNILQDVTNPNISRFEHLTKAHLKQLLVLYNVQIRGSHNASHTSLVAFCEEVFPLDFEIPKFDIDNGIGKNEAVLKIQNAYFHRKTTISQIKNANNDVEGAVEVFDSNSSQDCNNERILRHSSMMEKIRNNDLAGAEIEVEWIMPTWKKAKQFEAANRPHQNGQAKEKYDWKKATLGRHCTFSGCGEQLDLWNEGKTSEFAQFGSGITNYFKFLKWCCWIMLILSLMHIPIAIVNTFGASLQYDSLSFAVTSFGNLGSADSIDDINIPGCNESDFQQINCKINKGTIALIYAFLDTFSTILVILGWKWIQAFERSENIFLNRSTVTASDYTIRIDRIPKDATEAELAAHFARISSGAVAEVHLAYKNAKEIRAYFKRGKIMQKRFNVVQKIRYEKTKDKKTKYKGKNRRLQKLLKKRTKLTKDIRYKDAQREDSIDNFPIPIQGFVTFQKENGYINVLSAYQLSWIRSYFFLYPKKLRFKGKKLRVSQAPEPSTIIWENLECPKRERNLRKLLTTGVAMLAILFSVAFTFIARDFKSKVLENSIQYCPEGFLDLSSEKQFDIVKYDSKLSHCFCSTLNHAEQAREELCQEYLRTNMQSLISSYGAGFMIIFMNSFFTWLMDKAGSFEKHHSIDEMETSVMVRVFILKIINTGCLVLLYNQKWLQRLVRVRFDDEPDFGVTWYETGGLSLIIVMCINIFSPHVSPLFRFYKHRKKIAKIEKDLAKSETREKGKHKIWYSQYDLNKNYLGPYFDLKHRYTQILVNFYICWMYSTAMPLMPMIGAISFYVSYWIDKFLFCNFYRIPPRYSEKMGTTSTKLIGLSVIVHLVMSIAMMGNGKIFRSVRREVPFLGFEETALGQVHLLPLEMLLLGFVVFNLLENFVGGWKRKLINVFRCLICRTKITKGKLLSQMNTVQVDYRSAKKRGVIKGLASYNILQNPKYQEAFAVSPEFAEHHSHLNSIRGLNTKDDNICVPSGRSNNDDEVSDDSSDSDNSR